MKGGFMVLMPFLETMLTDAPREFDSLGEIVTLYAKQHHAGPQRWLHKLGKQLSALIRHPVPRLIEGKCSEYDQQKNAFAPLVWNLA